MTYTPAIPYSGGDAWTWVRDNHAALQTASDDAASVVTDAELAYFEANIGAVKTVEGLLNNARLRSVALGAFGLGQDGPRLDFLDSVMRRGTEDEATLARDLGDMRYVELTRAFGFGEYTPPRTSDPGFGADIVARFRIQAFEESVGAVDANLRRALIFERDMASLAAAYADPDVADDAPGWDRALADDSIARVLKSALRLPENFDRLSVAERRDAVASRMVAEFGDSDLSALTEQSVRDTLIKSYLDNEKAAARSFVSTPQARLVGDGLMGFEALTRSLRNNLGDFAAANRRDADLLYFERKIADILPQDGKTLGAQFAADERLMKVALTAFGLADSTPTAEFVASVLQSDPANPNSVASSLDDPRWAEMARFFGFGSGAGGQTFRFGFMEELADRYHLHQFEASIGAQDADMRSALLLNRGLEAIANSDLEGDAALRAALGQPALGMALKTALGLEDTFATLSLTGQVSAVKAALQTRIGSDELSDLMRGSRRDDLMRDFFRNAEADETPRGGLPQPVIPLEGLAGWRYLQETLDTQRERFAASTQMRREIDYFKENIGSIQTAEDLIADRRLLAVALEAYGLGSEIDKGAYIRKILEDGTDDPASFANRLADTRFREFSKAFGFGNGIGPQTAREGFAEGVVERYKIQAFETAVGDVDGSMRQALYFDRQAINILGTSSTDRAAWLKLLGDPALRNVVETAFNLPSEFSQADLDYQVGVIQDRASSVLGSSAFATLTNQDARENMLRRFFLGNALTSAPVSPFANALTLLRGGAAGGLNTLL